MNGEKNTQTSTPATQDDPAPPFPPPPLLSLKTCTIRPYHPADAPNMARHGNNHRIAQWMTNTFPHPYTLETARGWISKNQPPSPKDDAAGSADAAAAAAAPEEDGPHAAAAVWPAVHNHAICVGDECVGSIGLKPGADIYGRSAELGYWLGEDAWGRGIATEAVAAYVGWVFGGAGAPGAERLAARVSEGNDASARVLEKAGFRLEGTARKAVWKDGVWRDEKQFGLLREEWLEREGRVG